MPESETPIQALISRYLAEEIDADDLNDLLPDPWELDDAADPEAMDLLTATMGFLSGYQAGDRTETDLRRLLARLLATVQVEYEAPDLMTVFGSQSNQTILVFFEGGSSLSAGFARAASQHPRTKHRTTTALPDPQQSR